MLTTSSSLSSVVGMSNRPSNFSLNISSSQNSSSSTLSSLSCDSSASGSSTSRSILPFPHPCISIANFSNSDTPKSQSHPPNSMASTLTPLLLDSPIPLTPCSICLLFLVKASSRSFLFSFFWSWCMKAGFFIALAKKAIICFCLISVTCNLCSISLMHILAFCCCCLRFISSIISTILSCFKRSTSLSNSKRPTSTL
ncbi:hypothetical protein V8G54_030140 [Vigna mungo]|uniref:Uncharacterized protein n=1 Tax=Vigna mungo TaxID=3915 RepID=A0AAQ3MUN2_VIGMU